jgi:hypothetical protein
MPKNRINFCSTELNNLKDFKSNTIQSSIKNKFFKSNLFLLLNNIKKQFKNYRNLLMQNNFNLHHNNSFILLPHKMKMMPSHFANHLKLARVLTLKTINLALKLSIKRKNQKLEDMQIQRKIIRR